MRAARVAGARLAIPAVNIRTINTTTSVVGSKTVTPNSWLRMMPPMDPKDAFDFSVEHWNDQLVAGYSKTTSARGLKAHMPDYNDLARKPAAPKRSEGAPKP